ncbi:MAG TPA: helix-turn-helix domain-containing protein [Chitinophagaceae bacterium]|jgi:transcriptional regulator GlxA family with amidase domain|nr:helix-turn-helix domain-containing protein [Chitinophagaceae bacterium]
MKHIGILVPEGDCSLTHIEATHMMLSQVNTYREAQGKDPLFRLQLIAQQRTPQLKKRLYTVHPDATTRDAGRLDLLIIPAIQGDLQQALKANEPLVPWIEEQYHKGTELASMCIGSFLMASTGLLDGRQCTTHWSAAAVFRELFPEVELLPDKILTDDRGIYSSGGALSFQNLVIYLIEKYAGRDMAILCAKTFMVDIDRHSQSPFIVFQGQKAHDDEPISKAQEFIEKNYAEKLSVDQLADMSAVSRRHFERRFKKATANSILEYIQRVRIEAAKKCLETSRMNVSEVMYHVGYSDMKAFRTIFKKITGLSPVEYRNKYNPRAVAEV